MRQHAVNHKVDRISMPRIGCGLDNLNWVYVQDMIERVFSPTNIQITVYILDDGSRNPRGGGIRNKPNYQKPELSHFTQGLDLCESDARSVGQGNSPKTTKDHQQSNMSYYTDCFRFNPNTNCDRMKRNSTDSVGSPNYSEINFGRNISGYAFITYGGYEGNQQTNTSPSSVSYDH